MSEVWKKILPMTVFSLSVMAVKADLKIPRHVLGMTELKKAKELAKTEKKAVTIVYTDPAST